MSSMLMVLVITKETKVRWIMRQTSNLFCFTVLSFLGVAYLVPQHSTNRLQIDLSGKGVLDNETFNLHFDLRPIDDVADIVIRSCERFVESLWLSHFSSIFYWYFCE